ncbi:MAG: iron-sulfur cluster assembly protein [Halodesulfurarchaeum sp.]
MTTDRTTAVREAVDSVTHPEVDATLTQLGMIDDVVVSEELATITLALPMLNIPQQIKEILVGRLEAAVEETGTTAEVEITVMDDQQREQFFQLEQEHWSGGMGDVDGPEGGNDDPSPPF